MKLTLGFLLLFTIGTCVYASSKRYASQPLPTIDGKSLTIAKIISQYIIAKIPNGDIAYLIQIILHSLNQPEIDYWGNVKAEVETVVGKAIDAHNMHQIELYQNELELLMQRYSDAPVQSDTYPDKNVQATALSTSIIAHRYLIEGSSMPESLILHFEDISSIHIAILQDAAETYSISDDNLSRWWMDLDRELGYYINYGEQLSQNLRNWRMGQVRCEEQIADWSCTMWQWAGKVCYDNYKATDGVSGTVSECLQIHGGNTCSDHCEMFELHKQIELDQFYVRKINDVIKAWKTVKEVTEDKVAKLPRFYNPLKSI